MPRKKRVELALAAFLVRVTKHDGKRRWSCTGYQIENDFVYLTTVDDGLVILNMNFCEDLIIEPYNHPLTN